MAEKKESADGAKLAEKVAEKANKAKYIILVVLLIVAAVIGTQTYLRSQAETRRIESENQLFKTTIDIESNPEQDIYGVLGKFANDHADMQVGARAAFMQIAYAYNTNDFGKAEAAARDILKNHPQHPMLPRVRLALGQSLFMQNRLNEARSVFQELISSGNSAVLPEATLALAQTKEKEAEAAKDNPEEYKRLLEAAVEEYEAIASQSASPTNRSFWPMAIVQTADFNAVRLKDLINGHVHAEPRGVLTPEEREAVEAAPLPETSDNEETPEATENAGEEPVEAEEGTAAGETGEDAAPESDAEQPSKE